MAAYPFQPPVAPMEARVRASLPTDGGWAFEPKWDGFRALAWRGDEPDDVRLDSRNRKPLLRYFPEFEEVLPALPAGTVVDLEVVIVVDDALAFDQLQLRLHPARSRNLRLAAEIPAELVAFDLLASGGQDLRGRPFLERRERLVELLDGVGYPWHVTPSTGDVEVAREWFDAYASAGCEGIVCKRLDGTYEAGERAMLKVKPRHPVDVVVLGFREHKDGSKVGSLSLGVYDAEGELFPVGHLSGLPDEERQRLWPLLQRFRDHAEEGWDGVAGPASRWSPDKDMTWYGVTPGLVLEVSYDQTLNGQFRHGCRFERWRPDKDAEACTIDQLDAPTGPGFSDVVAG